MPKSKDKELKKAYNTLPLTKAKYWPKFASLIEGQFKHGGLEKYMLEGFPEMEATDLISQLWEESGWDEMKWILKTCVKYLCRFRNLHREKDLLKIATYMYILWLKSGFHLQSGHDTDTKR